MALCNFYDKEAVTTRLVGQPLVGGSKADGMSLIGRMSMERYFEGSRSNRTNVS